MNLFSLHLKMEKQHRLSYAQLVDRMVHWFRRQPHVRYKTDMSVTEYWVSIQSDINLVLSLKRDALYLKISQCPKRPRPFERCRSNARSPDDCSPCVKPHITIVLKDWNKHGRFHVTLYEAATPASKVLFDLYFNSCFGRQDPKRDERQQRRNAWRLRNVHVYFDVNQSVRLNVSRRHPGGRCMLLMQRTEFDHHIFGLVRERYRNISEQTLTEVFVLHAMFFQQVKRLVQSFSSIIFPTSVVQESGFFLSEHDTHATTPRKKLAGVQSNKRSMRETTRGAVRVEKKSSDVAQHH
jgi:hypothetical protein